ncbi:MAG TPA: PPOX class F420-dependent oxidoreductase [Solirubrobacterales bacterium]|nr:PPOX class F420-dependent oxidoreductase [Solirubrobacterales bacterium]
MSEFTDRELAYLGERRPERLARIATAGKDGTPHVVPVGWRFNTALDTIDVGGMDLPRSKKFRDVRRTGRAAIVIDDLASVDPWTPRGIEVRGSAEAIDGDRPLIRIHPERIVSWGLESDELGRRHSRAVSHSAGASH